MQPASTALTAVDVILDAGIIEAVASRLGILPMAMRGRGRERNVVYARHLAMYALKQSHQYTISEIGRLLGNKDHSTVLAAVQRIQMELTTRIETVEDYAAVRAYAARYVEGIAESPGLGPEAPADSDLG